MRSGDGCNAGDIASGVVYIGHDCGCCRRGGGPGIDFSGLGLELVQLVVGIFRNGSVGNRGAGRIGLLNDRNILVGVKLKGTVLLCSFHLFWQHERTVPVCCDRIP